MPMIPVTPHHDPAIEAIAIAIHDAVLAKWPDAIAGVSPCDYVPNDPTAFPHLAVHRGPEEGQYLENCRGVARYMVISPIERKKLTGLFRSMKLKITETLRDLEDPEAKWSIVQDQKFRSTEQLLGMQGGLIPFLEVHFAFVDVTPLG